MSFIENPNDAEVVVPDTPFTGGICRSIYVGVSGDVVVAMKSGNITFKAVPVGILQIRGTKVVAAGTTATNMLALH